jgi:hypothetical protein
MTKRMELTKLQKKKRLSQHIIWMHITRVHRESQRKSEVEIARTNEKEYVKEKLTK